MPKQKDITIFDLWPYNMLLAIFYTQETASRAYLPAVETVLSTISPREQKIMRLRYQEGMTLKEVADKERIGPERVRQVQDQALRKLRHPSRTIRLIAVSPDETACLNRRIRQLTDTDPAKAFVPDMKGFSLDDPIESLDLSVRSYNCLHKDGIRTIRDLSALTPVQLGKIRSLGVRSRDEILRKMAMLGLVTYTGSDAEDPAEGGETPDET